MNAVLKRVAGVVAALVVFFLLELATGWLGIPWMPLGFFIAFISAAFVYYSVSKTKPWWSR